MSEILSRLAACEQIIEWIDRHDERLAIATGHPGPNDGASVREKWQTAPGEESKVVERVCRLLIGQISLDGTVEATFDRQSGSVIVDFNQGYDWPNCFPIGEQTKLPTLLERPAWAAVALCDQLGLAVFSQQTKIWSAEVRVQPVPETVFQRLISSGAPPTTQ